MSKRQTYPTPEEAGRLNQRAPDPPAEPDWLVRAMSPEVQAEIERLAFGPRLPTVRPGRVVDHAEGRPVERQAGDPDKAAFVRAAAPGSRIIDHAAGLPADQPIGARNADLLPRPGTAPQPKPMHARTRVQAGGYTFPGLDFARAAEAAGFRVSGENSTVLAKARKHELVTAIGGQLAAASAAPDLETARANIRYARLYRSVLAVALAAIDSAITEVSQALGIES